MRISVIVPVLNEEKSIAETLQTLQQLKPDELIVVDGGSTDGTREICQRFGVALYLSRPGRAAQMNFGAQRASGDVLLFLHADTRLPPSAFDDIRMALQDRKVLGGRFDLQLDNPRPLLKLVGFMISLRSRLSKVGTLKRRGTVACLRSRVVSSARRWETDGIGRTILKMWTLKTLYLLGISPVRLKRYYDDTR
jgi:glycosyltransferase involved in cell wall biosynthesis